jgi:hypothetical protein
VTRRRTAALALAASLALGATACGDDGDDPALDEGDTTTTEATAVPVDEGAAAALPEDVCALADDAAASAATGLALTGAVPGGDERRRVCTFSPADNDGVGITIGVEGGSRFDEKAEVSEGALGAGDDVADLGDRALSFYSEEDIPEGVGGTLVAVGDLTVDVSVQGLADEAATRAAADALAALVVDGL